MDKINNQIQALLDQQSQNAYIEERLNHLDDKVKKLAIHEQALRLRSEEELEDVKELERLGLKSLFKRVIGNLEEQIEKERQEYLHAVIKHRSVQEEIEVLRYERDLLTPKFRNPKVITDELNQLTKKKQFLLKSYDTKFTKELFKRESELGRCKLLHQKATRVERKAMQAKEVLQQMLEKLYEVSDWPPSGKARYASFAKKKYIDKARKKAIEAKVCLDEFSDISEKLFQEEIVQYDLSGFETFLDRFYDNLITDYIVKSQLERTIDDITNTLADLSQAQEIVAAEILKQDQQIKNTQEGIQEFVTFYSINKEK